MLIIFATMASNVYGANCESVSTPFGTWNNNATWSCGTEPSGLNCLDTIFIDEHVYITAHVTLTSCAAFVMVINDTLRFQSGKKMYLPAGSEVILSATGTLYPEGGGGSSNIIQIGADVVWTTAAGTYTGPLVLDIELTDFYGYSLTRGIELKWITASETDNDYFTLERSMDGIKFKPIELIDGAGTSLETNYYTFLDNSPRIGINYYRLKQTDFNGLFTYSNTIAISYYTGGEKNNLWPNPTTDFFTISCQFNGDISIFDSSLRQICSIEHYSQGDKISISDLPSGVYFVTYSYNYVLKIDKLIVN